MLGLTLLGVVLVGCRRHLDSEGVELVLSSASPSPAMTFEVRFDQVMAKPGQIGIPTGNSPLLITPPLAGKFTWLSPRSGTFTPSEPLLLETRYTLSLRPGLQQADGRPAKVSLRRVLRTPPFQLVASLPQQASSNAASEPEIKLIFNADLRASDAQRFLSFRDARGRRIAAEVRQGMIEERPSSYQFEDRISLRTWMEEFAESASSNHQRLAKETVHEPTNEVGNLLIVLPRLPLSVGKDWKLVLDPGLPALDDRFRLRQQAEVPIGDVTPFTVADVKAQNLIYSGSAVVVLFSKPVVESLTNGLAPWVEATPAVSNMTAQVQGNRLILRGSLKSRTNYAIKFRAGLAASEPFRLEKDVVFSVTMPPVAPRLYFPAFSQDQLAGGHRSFPLLVVNVARVRLRAKLLEPHTAIHALRGYKSYFRPSQNRDSWEEPFRSLDYNLIPGHTVSDEEVSGTAQTDVATKLELSWDRMLAGRKCGVVFLEAQRADGESEQNPVVGTQALIQLTDLGMVWKRAPKEVQAFVFSHSTGQPVSGATVSLVTEENESLQQSVTDTNGLAHLAANTNGQWLVVQQGDDFHAVELREHNITPWGHGLSFTGPDEPEDSRRVMLITDRDLYRPGEMMHLKALVRDWCEQGLSIPCGLTGTLACVEARGREFLQTNVMFSASGAWSVDVPLPSAIRGAYHAQIRIGKQEYTHWFQVQDFQPSAFEIAVAPKAEFAASEPVKLPISARYYFGKQLSRAQVKWSLEAADVEFKPERFKDFNFRRTQSESRLGRGSSSLALQGEGMLTGSSNFIITPELPANPVAPQPRAVSLLVEVTDLNQQTLSRRVEFLGHSSEFYLGLRQGAEVLTADQPLHLEVLAVGANGQPWPDPVKARLKIEQIDWQPVRVRGAGRSVRYHNEAVVTNVLEQEIQVETASMPAEMRQEVKGQELKGLPLLGPGEYVLEIRARDQGDREVVSSLGFTVSAPAALGWDYRNDVQLKLEAEKTPYVPGQVANVLVQSPFNGLALVTVERERVFRSFLARLEGNAPMVQVPIKAAYAPNVFVCVTLLRGAKDSPHKTKEPEYRVGYCELAVADPQTRLVIEVATGATNYLPAQSVEVTAEVKDLAGVVVPKAEVTLYAVDEGILSLTGYDLPDPHAFFYSPLSLGVQSCVSLPNLLPEDPEELRFENKGYLGGGGGREHLRKNFLACAFWHANLSTDVAGKVSAHFPAPDTLTRYRVFAVVHEGNARFGSGQTVFQVSKPLIVEPALPRFANFSDHLLARAVVQNQTAQAGKVLVTIQLDDKAKAAGPPQSLTRQIAVAAHSSAVAEFPLDITEAGTAKWIWNARFARPAESDFADVVQSTLEIGHVAPLLREILLARVCAMQTNLLAEANPQLLAGQGAVTVSVANTRISELGETVSQLLHYPYGCAEQTGSSMLPWIVLRDMPSLRSLTGCGSDDFDAAIRAGMTRFWSMQTASGGLGYWPRAKEPMLWASAYGGLVLALAERHGVEMPQEEFGKLMDFLGQQLRSITPESDLSDYCLALYALAVGHRAEPAYHERLYDLRERLSVEDRTLLALAALESHGPKTMVSELLKVTARQRHQEPYRFGSPARERAIQLLAWTRYQPDNPSVDGLVNHLMIEQKQAHWGTTQGDAWALLALTEYARRIEGKLEPIAGRLLWQDQTIPFQVNGNSNVFTWSFPATNLEKTPLILINESSNRLFASTCLEVRPPVSQQPRQDRGFSLVRDYDRLDDNNRPHGVNDLHVGDRVLVTLQLAVRDEARFVVVDDPLPSILEIVNPEFKTQEARGGPRGVPGAEGENWIADFQERRKDRFLSFGNWVPPGNYTLRYLARVRAAGIVTAPSAKAEEMYHPERYGVSETQTLSSKPWE